MPLIILEGAQAGGKSTLAAELREAWPGPSKVMRPGSVQNTYGAPFHDYKPSLTKLMVCDRWHLGELVYGPLLRGGSRLTMVERYHLELFLAGLGAVLFHVQVPEEDLARRLRQRGEDTAQALEAASRYRGLLQRRYATAELPTVSVVSPVVGQTLKALLRHATHVAEAATCLSGRYLGPVAEAPELLLAADRSIDSLPWAMEVFYQLSRHRTLGLVNAHQHPDLDHLATRRGTKVVALGREAAKALDRLGLKHGTINHPNWWKRSRFDDQEGYATDILRAAHTQEDYSRS